MFRLISTSSYPKRSVGLIRHRGRWCFFRLSQLQTTISQFLGTTYEGSGAGYINPNFNLQPGQLKVLIMAMDLCLSSSVMDGPYEHRSKKRWSSVLHGDRQQIQYIWIKRKKKKQGSCMYVYNFNGLASLWMMIEVIAGLDSSRRDIRRQPGRLDAGLWTGLLSLMANRGPS